MNTFMPRPRGSFYRYFRRSSLAQPEREYERLAMELCQVDVRELTLRSQGLEVAQFGKGPITEFGLPEDVAVLFARRNRDNGGGVRIFHMAETPPEMEGLSFGGLFGLQYDWQDVADIERSVWISERLRAIATAIETAEAIRRQRGSRALQTDSADHERRIRALAIRNIANRERMRVEIDEGLRRILGPYPKRSAPMVPAGIALVTIDTGRGWTQLALHGGQLRTLIRRGGVYTPPRAPDLIVMGHFHLQMVIVRRKTPVVFSGHLVMSRVHRRPGMTSHVGSPLISYGNELSITLIRGPFS